MLREVRGAALLLAIGLLSSSCSATQPSTHLDQGGLSGRYRQAARLDRASGTSVYSWLVGHEPSRLDVARGSRSFGAAIVPETVVRAAGNDLRHACRVAKHEHALLLVFVSAASPQRPLALDCGFALERDPAAVVVAPL